MPYNLRRVRQEKRKQQLRKRVVTLVVLVCVALTAWALWVGATQLWSMRSPARINTTDDGCIKVGNATKDGQTEVCPDKKR